MLKKKFRLNLAKAENALIFARGNSDFSQGKMLLLHARANHEHLKISVVAPKRLFRHAVERTQARSLLYSLLSELISEKIIDYELKKDLVLVYRCNFEQLKAADNDAATIKELLRLDLKRLLTDL